MAKTIDLTEKLGLAGKPTITIDGTTLTIDDSAKNMLRVMEQLDDEPSAKDIIEMCDLIFDAKSREALESLELSFPDFVTVVMTAIDLAVGDVDEEGNALTPATT